MQIRMAVWSAEIVQWSLSYNMAKCWLPLFLTRQLKKLFVPITYFWWLLLTYLIDTQVIDTKKRLSLAFFDFRCRQHFYQKNFEVGLFFRASYRLTNKSKYTKNQTGIFGFFLLQLICVFYPTFMDSKKGSENLHHGLISNFKSFHIYY